MYDALEWRQSLSFIFIDNDLRKWNMYFIAAPSL
jgi:hypothetical protein